MAKKSQQDLADHLYIDRNTLASWESETTDIKSSYLPKIAKFLDVSISKLFDLPDQEINMGQQNKNRHISLNATILILIDENSLKEIIDSVNAKLK